MRETPCEHSLWKFPNPLPEDGDACLLCGARYEQPAWLATLDQRTREDLRALCEIFAWRKDLDRGRVSPFIAAKERRRIAAMRGWLERDEREAIGENA